jgi:pimeloyl-ACP methyl ester carboxylesterase
MDQQPFMRFILHALIFLTVCGVVGGQSLQPTGVVVNGVELHYVEQGRGEALIFLHGGSGDYRAWELQIKIFSLRYHAISYSRRYSYPNQNPSLAKNHSAYVEAEDLAALIHRLGLQRVNLVGTSYGAFTALVLALKHPEMVHTLVLSEPPVHQLIRDTPDGEAAYHEFMTNVWKPAGEAFKAGDDKAAMKILSDGIFGPGRRERLTPESLAPIMQNARSFKALTLSSDPFPKLSKRELARLRIPTLIITGENTTRIHKLVTAELARLIPNAESVMLPRAGHGSLRDNPQAFDEAVLKFLTQHND